MTIRFRSRVLVAGFAAVLSQPASGQQAGPATAPPPTVIYGRVVDGDSGSAVPGAVVRVSGRGDQPPTMPIETAINVGLAAPQAPNLPSPAMTDAGGRFVFVVAPGRYTLSASRPGHLLSAYGQWVPSPVVSKPLDLAPSAERTDVVMRMWREASITGRVLDDAGEPAVGVVVRALRVARGRGGTRFTPAGSTVQTDDRGAYRLAALVPGEYVVVAPSSVASVPTSFVERYTAASSQGDLRSFLDEARQSGAILVAAQGGMRVGDDWIQENGQSSLAVVMGSDGRLAVHPSTYHPAATDPNRATVITLRSGEDRNGVDIDRRLATAAPVTGRVTAPEGPAAHLTLRLLPAGMHLLASDFGFEMATTVTDAEGRFRFPAVPPGSYDVRGVRLPRQPATAAPTTTTVQAGAATLVMSSSATVGPPPVSKDPVLYAETVVTVAEQPVHDADLVLAPGARLSGTLVFEGNAAVPPAGQIERMTITLLPADGGRSGAAVPPGRADAALQFNTPGYKPGRYLVTTGTPGPPWRVKSVMAGAVDLLDEPVELDRADVTGVVITLTDRSASLKGHVQPSQLESADDARVIAFPADYAEWIANGQSARRMRSVVIDAQRAWEIAGLPAGEYLVLAVCGNAPVDLQDPATFEGLASLGTRVLVTDTGGPDLSLTVHPGSRR